MSALLITPGLSGLGKNRGWRKPCVSVWVGQDNCSRVVMMSYYPAHTTATQPGYPAPSPGSGLPLQAEVLSVRQLTRSRQLRSGCLVLAGAGGWGELSTVSMNIQFHLAISINPTSQTANSLPKLQHYSNITSAPVGQFPAVL